MTILTPRELLRAAADYMDAHGKTEGQYESPTGQVCAYGAMGRVLGFQGQYGSEDTPTVEWTNFLNFDEANSDLIKQAGQIVVANVKHYILHEWSDANDETTVISTLRDLSKEPESE